MATLHHGDRVSRFLENSFTNKCLTSKFPLLLIFIFLWPLAHEIWVWALFRANFGCNDLMKFCSFSVLKQVCFIRTNFCNDWLKNSPHLRDLVFLLNKELYKLCCSSEHLSIMTLQIKYKKWRNFRSRFDVI